MNQFLRQVKSLTIKEIKQLYREPGAVALTFIVPILMTGALGFATVGITGLETDVKVPVLVVDEDHSDLSIMLRDSLTNSKDLDVKSAAETLEVAQQIVARGDATGAIIIPKDFGRKLASGSQVSLILIVDTSKHTAPRTVQLGLAKILTEFKKHIGTMNGQHSWDVTVDLRTITGRRPGGWNQMPALLGLAIVLSSFDDVIIAINRERERGTLTRLSLAPVNRIALFLGKTLASVTLTIARTTEMLLVFVFGLGLSILGNVALVYLTAILIGACTLTLGFVLSTQLRGETTITLVEIATTFPLLSLTGVLFPLEMLSRDGRAVANVLPWTYGNDALRRVISLGQGFGDISTDLVALVVATSFFLGLAVVLFRRTEA